MKKVLSTIIAASMLVSMFASPICANAADTAKEYILGDVDRSGTVTAADAKKVRSLIKIGEVGSFETMLVADVDRDGVLTDADIELIAKAAEGINEGYGIGSPVDEVLFMGDINGDLVVNNADAVLVQRYLKGEVYLNNERLIAADVNEDGYVTLDDVSGIQNSSAYPRIGKLIRDTYKVVVMGDVNGDYKVDDDDALLIKNYWVNGKGIENDRLIAADVNEDGAVTEADHTMISGRLKADSDSSLLSSDAVNMAIRTKLIKYDEVTYWGDINGDGEITVHDASAVLRYRSSLITLSDEEFALADVNGDGKLTRADYYTILHHIIGSEEYYTNVSKPSTFLRPKTVYYIGDADGDGVITRYDLDVIDKFLAGTMEITGDQYIAADIDSDQKVTESDRELLKNYLNGKDKTSDVLHWFKSLPVHGDVNNDGIVSTADVDVLADYLEGDTDAIPEDILDRADVNGDGKVDATDLLIIDEFAYNYPTAYPVELPIYVPRETQYIIGDANGDGVIDERDLNAIDDHISGKTPLPEERIPAADIDGDGEVTDKDRDRLDKFLNGDNTDTDTPIGDDYDPDKPKVMLLGDVNGDNKIDDDDVNDILKHINGIEEIPEERLPAADIDGDGEITKDDAQLLNDYIHGKPVDEPIAQPVKVLILGDVDGDGDIDTDDVNDILRHINGIEEIPEDRQPAADIDRDGEITKNDAELLQKYLDNKDKDSDRNSDTDSKDTDGKDSDNADTDTDDNDIGKPVNPYTGKDDTDTDNNGGNGGNSSDTDKNGGKDNNSDSDKNGGKDNNSDTDNSKDFEYEEDTDGSIIITGYTGTDEDVVIPNKIDDKPVKTIDDGAFKDNDGIKDITIPDSVENIADDAFDGHGDDLTIHGKPGSEAEKFADDNDIPFVPIGGENPDDNPGKIDTPDIPDTPDTPDSPDNPQREGFTYRVDPDGNAIITGYIGDAENLEIPEEIDGYPVKGIDDGAFKDKDGLKGMIIPKNVDSIGDDAFDGLGDDFTIYGYIGTEAEKHADEHNINFVPLAYLIGDVNADGKITAMDSLMVQRNTIALMKFTQAQTVRGDVDFNKRVTNRDALDILRYSIKLHTSSHVGEEITLEQLQSI